MAATDGPAAVWRDRFLVRLSRYIFLVAALALWPIAALVHPHPHFSAIYSFPEIYGWALGLIALQLVVWLVLLRGWKKKLLLIVAVAACGFGKISHTYYQEYAWERDRLADAGGSETNLGNYLAEADTTTLAYRIFADFVKHHRTDGDFLGRTRFPEYTGTWVGSEGFRFGATMQERYTVRELPEQTGMSENEELAQFEQHLNEGKDLYANGVVVDDCFLLAGAKLPGLRLLKPQSYQVTSGYITDGDYWFALYDPVQNRYWIVRGGGWGREVFRGPYTLSSKNHEGAG